MANLKEWLLGEANGEDIEAVVIGEMGWGDYGSKEIRWGDHVVSEGVLCYEKQPKGIILTWEEAIPWLDYEFYEGHGAPGCNAVWAWTKTKVIAIGQYDGATWPYSIPLYPIAEMPKMEGG